MTHFGFTKVVVADLERCAGFYATTFGLVEQQRVHDEIAGRPIDEILYAPTRDGGATFVLLSFADGEPAPGGVICGFLADDVDGCLARAVEAGGGVAQPAEDMPEYGHRVGFCTDPEGRLIEVVGPLRGGAS
jgi:predicted enzyme related to lactoylglutathione lyase